MSIHRVRNALCEIAATVKLEQNEGADPERVSPYVNPARCVPAEIYFT